MYNSLYLIEYLNKRFNHRIDILIHPSDKTRFKKENVKIVILK